MVDHDGSCHSMGAEEDRPDMTQQESVIEEGRDAKAV